MTAFYEYYPFSIDDKVIVPSYTIPWRTTNAVIYDKIDDNTYRVQAGFNIYPVNVQEIKRKRPIITASKEFYKKHKKLKKYMNEYGKYNSIMMFHCSGIRDNCIRSIKELSDDYYKYLPMAICIDEE